MITFPPLYDVASTGKVKLWTIAVQDVSPTLSTITIAHGLEHGKMQTTVRKVTAGKNVGRSNATTIFEQAQAEAESFWTKKQDKGYAPTKTSTKKKAVTAVEHLPMLALKFDDRKHDVVWPAYIQPKLNGVRCLVERLGNTITFRSRGNKTFTTLDHLVPDCLKVLKNGELMDGELYSHGGVTFQELIALIKREKNADIDGLKKYVYFWNYDWCLPEPFHQRQRRLKDEGYIKAVPTYQVQNEQDARAYHAQFTQEGYEGSMIRSGGDEPYRSKYRSPSLLKLKDFQDDDFVIIGAKDSVGKAEGQCVFRCQTTAKDEFDVRMKGTDETRLEQWKNRDKYMGKLLTCRFQNLSDEGIPIFPVGIAIRDYE